jgi:hypothetical protein
LLGLTNFVEQLKKHTKIIAFIAGAVSIDLLISYAIWANRVISAISDFHKAADKIGDLKGLLGDALANITKSIQPAITTGFYMVCIGALFGLVASILVFRKHSQNVLLHGEGDLSANPEIIDPSLAKKEYFGIPQLHFFAGSFIAILGLIFVVSNTGSTGLANSLDLGQSSSSSTGSSSTKDVSSDVFRCFKVENMRNIIKLNQPSFNGDPSPTDIFAASQFRFTNNCDKNVVGIKGSVSFQNVVGDTIFNGGYTNDQTVPVGGSITTSLDTGWTFNQFEDQHGQLAGIDQTKTHAVMTISKVAFEDGTSLNG